MSLPLPDPAGLGLFVVAALLLVTPGPAILYIVARSVDQGRRAGLISMLGVHAGTLVHVAAAAAGLSAVLATSAAAFNVVKYVGNVLNPKTALFFLAFLPQFVAEGRGHAGALSAVGRPGSHRTPHGPGHG